MIIPTSGLRIVIALKPVDFRKGHDGLAAVVQNELGLDPYSGIVVVFRPKRADRVKILTWDGTGLVLAYMILPRKSGRGQAAIRSMSAGERYPIAECRRREL